MLIKLFSATVTKFACCDGSYPAPKEWKASKTAYKRKLALLGILYLGQSAVALACKR